MADDIQDVSDNEDASVADGDAMPVDPKTMVVVAPAIAAPVLMALPPAQIAPAPAANDGASLPVVPGGGVPPQSPVPDGAQPAPLAQTQGVDPQVAMLADQAPDAAAADVAPDQPTPVKAEAVSLLQLVRDHMKARPSHGQGEDQAAKQGATRDTAPDGIAAMTALPSHDGAAVPLPPSSPAVVPTTVAAAPTVDLSASIGAQVVDMGVSGQWIDGLARDIAGLSANGAQGRFQINADQLGQIQVDIRQGEDGAAVSLTVTTEEAELALRQDSDRLKLDASLSAVRISEVKVERASPVAETARSDAASNQSGSQPQSPSQGQSAGWQGQGMGQSSAQSQMQGRGQQRENIAFNHKGGSDPAVLNHERAGGDAGDMPRARYA
mgnify:CR=1 FL=1